MVPALLANTAQLREQVRQAAQMLTPDVVGINFDIDVDAMGVGAIFFKIVLSDEASRPAKRYSVARHVSLTLEDQLRTDENGVHAHFNFRSQSEMASINDPAWATML